MSVDEKYELLEKTSDSRMLAIQRRLGRQVVIHRFSKRQFAQASITRLRETVSRLSRIDHLAIPHLIDFVDTEESYWVVLEFRSHSRLSDSEGADFSSTKPDIVDSISEINRMADALGHAKQCGIFHGNLNDEQLAIDRNESVHVLNLGLIQLKQEDGRSAKQLALADFDSVCDLIASRVREFTRSVDESAESTANAHDFHRQVAELESIVEEVRTVGPTIELLHEKLSQWLAIEFNAREAKKLSFEEGPVDARPTRSFMVPLLLSAIGSTCALIMGLTAYLFWPSGSGVPASPSVAKKSDEIERSIPRPTVGTRSLDDFGPPKKAESVVEPQAEKDAKSSSTRDKTPELSPKNGDKEIKNSDEVAPARNAQNEPPPHEKTEEPKATKPPKKQRKESPFVDCPPAVDLPRNGNAKWATIVSTTLESDDPLDLELLGGDGAYKLGEYQISGSSDIWSIRFVLDGESVEVARIAREGSELQFQWNEAEKKNSVPAYIANTVLLLESQDWSHAVALREYKRLPFIRVNLDRKKPYELGIDQCPKFDDVMLEFVPSDGELMKVLGRKSIIKAHEELQIGLEAEEDSLFAVQIEPKFKFSKQNLYVKAFGRPNSNSKFSPLRRGYGVNLNGNAQKTAQALFQLKVAKEKAKDDQERVIGQRIKLLESKSRSLEKLVEAYAAAVNSHLGLKIYRQVGNYQVPLVRVGSD